jgi:hypothetical protein
LSFIGHAPQKAYLSFPGEILSAQGNEQQFGHSDLNLILRSKLNGRKKRFTVVPRYVLPSSGEK